MFLFLLKTEMGFPELFERRACSEKVFLSPFSNFFPMFEVNNAISILDSGEAMGDENLGDLPMELFDGHFDFVFTHCIERRGCFIKDEDRGVFNKSAGNR